MPLVLEDSVGETAWSSPGTTADIFVDSQELTITAAESGDLVQIFHPAQWLRCTVFDDDGYPLFSFTNGRYGAAALASPSAA